MDKYSLLAAILDCVEKTSFPFLSEDTAVEESTVAAKPFDKDHGVYLITGGCGGLGFIIAKNIANTVQKPALILTGRSEVDHEIESKITELEESGATARYLSMDVCKKEEVAWVIATIQEDFDDKFIA